MSDFFVEYREVFLVVFFILLLLFFSAFFSASETAMTSLSRARLSRLVSENNLRARLVQRLLDSPSRLLTSILIGNNAVNILASVLATSLMISYFGNSGIIYATLIMTVLIVIFAEVLPKNIALMSPERIAFQTAPLLRLLMNILSPFVSLLRPMVRYMLRKSIKDKQGIAMTRHVIEELRGTIELSRKQSASSKAEYDMLDGVLDLSELDVSDLMVHRIKFHSIDIDLPLEQIIDRLIASPYTRMPVFRGKQDNIIGVINIKSFMREFLAKKMDMSKFNLPNVMMSPWFVPETTNAREQLNAFLQQRQHFAIVVDEYGEVMGLVTLEDILEEIVGQIVDEHDSPGFEVKPGYQGAIEVQGSLSVRELNRIKDWSLPDDKATTIAGLVIGEAEIIPESGQSFNFFGFRFDIIQRDGNRITKIKVQPLNVSS